MSEPPRRRRTPPSSQRPPSSSVWPTVALGIGVVVAGLGIGAFLSAVQHKGSQTTTATTSTASQTAPVVTPVARPTRGPLAAITAVPHPTATPTPAATPTPRPTPRPTATSLPSATATPAATPTPLPTATPPATETPPSTPKPRATATPATVVTARPTARPATPRPTERPTPAPAVVARGPAGFGAVAQSAVRRYLADLIAGNETAAYAALGKNPGDAGALSEEAFIDRGTRITGVRTTASDAAGATVEVEIVSSRGSYFATYHVSNTPAGPVIDQHDYIKV